MSCPQRHQKTLSKGELRREPKSALSPAPQEKTQAPHPPRQEASASIMNQYRQLVEGSGCSPCSHTVPDFRSITACHSVPFHCHFYSTTKSSFPSYRNCRWILILEHSGAKEEEIHHMESCPACYNLTSLAHMLSPEGNAVKHPLSHLKNKMKTQDLQVQVSFFQFPRQTAEDSLELVRTQNPFIGSWIVSFTYLKRWLGLLVSYCLCPCLVSPSL